MKRSKSVMVLSGLIAVLAAVAAGAGILWTGGGGGAFEFTTLRGEIVMMYGVGLYRYEPVFSAAQVIPQDIVTLVVGIPLLLAGLWGYWRGQLRGHLVLAGTLGYFLYTYTSMAFGAAYNALFLVYVALFSLSLFAFIQVMVAVDLAGLPDHFGAGLPRRGIALFLFASAGFLVLAWLGRIVPALMAGVPPVGLGSGTTLFIQVLDLGVVVPVMVMAGVGLWRRAPLGYLLAAVGLIKFVTMGLALVAMIIGQWVAGVPMTVAEMTVFPCLALVAIVMTVRLLQALQESVAGSGEIGGRLPSTAR